MSQVEPLHMNAQFRVTTPKSQLAGQRRSYDQAFSSSQSPLTTPTILGAYYPSAGPPGAGMLSPGPAPLVTPLDSNDNSNDSSSSINNNDSNDSNSNNNGDGNDNDSDDDNKNNLITFLILGEVGGR